MTIPGSLFVVKVYLLFFGIVRIVTRDERINDPITDRKVKHSEKNESGIPGFIRVHMHKQNEGLQDPGKKTRVRDPILTFGSVKEMSHITTTKTGTKITNQTGIKSAIALMAKEFPGLTYEQKNPDVIQIRYNKIEGYQTKGNMRLVKNGSEWDLQLDPWQCHEEVMKVKTSFEFNYVKAGSLEFSRENGYMTNEQPIENGIRLVAVKY